MTVLVELQDAPGLLGLDRKELMSRGSLAAWGAGRSDWGRLHITYNTRYGTVGVLVLTVTNGHGMVQAQQGRITDSDDEVVKIGDPGGARKVRLVLRTPGEGDVPVEISTSQRAWFARRLDK
jgi:hypothetical protein